MIRRFANWYLENVFGISFLELLIGASAFLLTPVLANNRSFPAFYIGCVTLIVFSIGSLALGVIDYRSRNRIQKRIAAGLCLNCGYDLFANKDRCPECGRAIDPKG